MRRALLVVVVLGCGPGELGDGGHGLPDDWTVSLPDPGPPAPTCAAERRCGDACCDAGQACVAPGVCATPQGACTTTDDCWYDTYCQAGTCLPYEVPVEHDRDGSCEVRIDVDALVPDVQCRWSGPPPGDAHPAHVHVMSTPMVVDFNFDEDAGALTIEPSIVFTTFPTSGSYGQPGVLRVIDGADCTQQYSFDLPADATLAPASVALGDIDRDGRAEIVAPAHGGGLLAFRYDPGTRAFARLWRSGTCSGGSRTPDAYGPGAWSGPSIHDLDDDGSPEIVLGAVVYGADGCIRSASQGFPAYSVGVVPVVADVDEDGLMELVRGNAIHEWRGGDWQPEAYFGGAALAAGQVAIADLGPFPLASFAGADRPEVVVVSAGSVRVQTIEGRVVFGPIAIPGGGTGGPPTIADFDGDGRRELASAGGDRYAVFDLDCVAGGDAARCGGAARTDGVLWSQPSQDHSSNVTGSSVFDFDANGSAEAVYADECFLRIYEGASGRVLYSAARSSGTTYENPVIADVDGDFHTEVVSAVNDYAGALGCPAADPLRPSTPFATGHGVVVLRDVADRWATSRPVWSQHAYAVTHVGDRGEIPRTSAVARNWRDPALDNFRQNVQGGLAARGIPDLTVGERPAACSGTTATLAARVCNRGTLPQAAGVPVHFLDGSAGGPLLCAAQTAFGLAPGDCAEVSCAADLGQRTVDVAVIADPGKTTEECWERNNGALLRGVSCAFPQ